MLVTLRKQAYSNVLKILPPKNENFQIKISGIFHIPAQNIDCEYSIEPPRRVPQSMCLSRNKKNNVYVSMRSLNFNSSYNQYFEIICSDP